MRYLRKRQRVTALMGALTVAGGVLSACQPPPKVTQPPLSGWQSTTAAQIRLARPIGGVNQDGLLVREHDTGLVVSAQLICKDGGTDVSCGSSRITTIWVVPSQYFRLGQYYQLSFASRFLDSKHQPPITGPSVFRAGPREEDQAASPTYTWATRLTPAAIGGSFTYESRRGARATINIFGPWVTVWTMTGSTHGLMDIYIDHVLRRTVDTYSARTRYRVPFSVDGMTNSGHRLDIVVRGTKGTSASSGTDVVVDAVQYARGSLSTPDFEYTWGSDASTLFSKGWVSSAQAGGAVAGIRFRGTSIEVATMRGPWSGIYRVYLDHRSIGEFDDGSLHAGIALRRFDAVTDSVHLLELLVLGRHTSVSRGNALFLDYWQLGVNPMGPAIRDLQTSDEQWGRTQFLPADIPAAPTASASPAAAVTAAAR